MVGTMANGGDGVKCPTKARLGRQTPPEPAMVNHS